MTPWRINGRPATEHEVAALMAKFDGPFMLSYDKVDRALVLTQVGPTHKREVFWAVGYGLLIGCFLSLGVFLILVEAHARDLKGSPAGDSSAAAPGNSSRLAGGNTR